jgi:hypothetical protein
MDAVIVRLFGSGKAAIANLNYPKARTRGSMVDPYAVKAADYPTEIAPSSMITVSW